jgi:hypothetical protein
VGVLKREAPQSKQTEIIENVRTPGLVTSVGREKWSMISPGNSASYCDEHCAQAIEHTPLVFDIVHYRAN